MLKLKITKIQLTRGLITVQDNTMLKLKNANVAVSKSLITVQDNTMLKQSPQMQSPFMSLITVQDNTMLKLKFKHLCAQPAEIPNDISYYPTFIISPLSFLHNYFA